jgi:uncharacterized cupin superfamily protein
MMKPVLNLDELTLISDPPTGKYQSCYAPVSSEIGAKKLGYNLTVLDPGMRSCPFHNHHVNEEMFIILEGEGTLRFGSQEFPVGKHDVIAAPPGGRDVAHQIINTGSTQMRFLAISTKEPGEICEYPDSNKVGVFVGEYGKMKLRRLFKDDAAVDYMTDELTSPER